MAYVMNQMGDGLPGILGTDRTVAYNAPHLPAHKATHQANVWHWG